MQKATFLPPIVFEIIKFKKLYNMIGLEHFELQLKNLIFQPCNFHRFPKATMMYHLKPKNHIDEPFFFQNLYCRFISEHFGHP